MKNKKIIKNLRYILLALFLVFISVETYLHQVLGGKEAPSIHALCPYGALESLNSLVFGGGFIQKIYSGTFIILIVSIVIALVFRRSFCGLICPFGALQEFFGLIGKKIFKKQFTIPTKVDKPLRYLKYIVLVITLFFAWQTANLWINPYDPWAAYGHISTGISSLFEEYLFGLIVLIVVLVGSLLYDRFFCKYLCPMGAFYGLISKISPSRIVRNEDKCINCGLCNKNCPVNIKVSELKEVKTAECINCQKCVLCCPKDDALSIRIKDKKVKPIVVMIIVFILFFGVIGTTKILGIYEVLPNKITSETKISPDEIKGYMTIEDLSVGFNMELMDVYQKLGLPTSVPKETQLKDVKNIIPDFEVEEAREKFE